MKNSIIKGCIIAILSVTSFVASAQNSHSNNLTQQNSAIKVSSEFGLGVGARYNFFDVLPLSADFTPKVSMRMSYGAALQFRLNIGKVFGIQPEVTYSYSTIKFSGGDLKSPIKAKSNVVQIPMLLSLKFSIVRLNFGPVFTVMDNPTYSLANSADDSIQQMPLGPIFPTVTYAAGISIKLPRNMIVDMRYTDQIKDITTINEFYWTLDKTKQSEALKFRTRSRSVQLRFGLVF